MAKQLNFRRGNWLRRRGRTAVLAKKEKVVTDPLHTPPLYNEVGYGPNPFRAESGPSHLPTAAEVAGRHELWLEAVGKS